MADYDGNEQSHDVDDRRFTFFYYGNLKRLKKQRLSSTSVIFTTTMNGNACKKAQNRAQPVLVPHGLNFDNNVQN